jgi:hypothetical protein
MYVSPAFEALSPAQTDYFVGFTDQASYAVLPDGLDTDFLETAERVIPRLVSEVAMATAALGTLRRRDVPTAETFVNVHQLGQLLDEQDVEWPAPCTSGSAINRTTFKNAVWGVIATKVFDVDDRGEPKPSFLNDEALESPLRVATGTIQVAGHYITRMLGIAPDQPVKVTATDHETTAATLVMDSLLEVAIHPQVDDRIRDGRLPKEAFFAGWYADPAFHPDFQALASQRLRLPIPIQT